MDSEGLKSALLVIASACAFVLATGGIELVTDSCHESTAVIVVALP